MPDRSRRGFTIVEILVVLGIIVLLVGLIAVGLQAAGRSARKAKELNTGRQVGLAWSQYSATYEEKLIPGWLEPEVQQAWKVKYKNSAGDTLDPEFCRTYSWRLLPFLSYDFETLYTYLELEDANFNANPAVVSDNPAFGINAYYVGGWWEPFSSDPGLPATGRPVFSNAAFTDGGGQQLRGRLVVQSAGSIRRPSDLVVFAASAYREPGFYKDRATSYQPGAAWVVPPKLGSERVWQLSYGDDFQELTTGTGMLAAEMAAGIRVFEAQAVPIARHNVSIATVRADLSTDNAGINQLEDLSRWIDVAGEGAGSGVQFEHTDD